MEKDTGGAAFPCEGGSDSGLYADAGMTLRDYFAGQALSGLCADPSNHDFYDSHEEAAETCYQIADAMLEARE